MSNIENEQNVSTSRFNQSQREEYLDNNYDDDNEDYVNHGRINI